MRVVQIGFGILMLSGVAAFGCGGEDTSNTPAPGTGGKGGGAGAGTTGGTAGSGGTGGTAGTGGATGGTGGATGGTGGATGGTGGGSGSGGASGAGGSSGSAGMNVGGEGGGSGEECPATAPTDGDDCDNDVNPGGGDDPCAYAGEIECSCTGFMNPTWSCEAPPMCPATAPTDGDDCDTATSPGGGDDPCVYDGMVECSCGGGGGPGGGMGTWNCAAPPMCPVTAPTDGDDCDTDTDPGAMDGGCTIGMTTCVCAGGGGGGGMQTWNCGTCPATAPGDGDDCDNMVNAFCTFADTDCTCGGNDEWNCN
jgi:hypothetical protein